jgi:hypothetical protein
MKEIPNPNYQIPNKFQITISKQAESRQPFEIWNFGF